MFGGVSKSYVDWKLGEPFRENGVYYVMAEHPKYKMQKKVRWYADVEHAKLMPGFKENSPIWQTFHFDSPADKIICVKVDMLSEDEIEEFRKSWKESSDKDFWSRGQFFNDVFYGNKRAKLPNIKNKDAIFECSWKEFYNEGHERSIRMKHFSDYWKKSFDEIDWSEGGKYAI